MRRVGASLAVLAAVGLVGGQAFGQGAAVAVGDAPVHAVPADANGPVEADAVPGTLNAQYATQSRSAPPPAAAQSRAPEGPAVAFAPSLIDAAGAFDAYMRSAAAIDPKFGDGGAVEKAVDTGAGYEIGQFEEGMVAYAALAALQDAAFVQDLSDIARDARDRDSLSDQIIADPKAVMQIDGADEAAGMVSHVLAKMGVDLLVAGKAVKQSAYDVQHQPWSKEAVPNPEKRLADTKSRSAAKASLDAAHTDALIKTIVALRDSGGQSTRAGQPSPVVLRGLAVAALAVFGRAGEADLGRIEPLLSDGKSADCMKMAKLNLYQCMAVAGPHYEDVFCLGQHALIDTGQCVLAAAGGQSAVPAAEMQTVSAPAPRAVSVPIFLNPGAGPERQRAYAPVPEAPAAPIPAPAPVPPPAPAPEPAVVAAAPEVRDYAPVQRDYAPVQRDYAPVQRDYAPVQRDYAPAPRDYAEAPRAAQPTQAPAPRDERYYDDRYADPRTDAYANRYDPYANRAPAPQPQQTYRDPRGYYPAQPQPQPSPYYSYGYPYYGR